MNDPQDILDKVSQLTATLVDHFDRHNALIDAVETAIQQCDGSTAWIAEQLQEALDALDPDLPALPETDS